MNLKTQKKRLLGKLSATLFIAITLFACNKQPEIKFAGADFTDKLEIRINKETRVSSLNVNTDGKWNLYAGTSVESIDTSKPILEGAGSGKFTISDKEEDTHNYYLFTNEEGQAILSVYHLPMKGGYNFREMGGIRNTEGRYTKWGKIFRTDELGKLEDIDLEYLSKIPMKSIVDFRSAGEIEKLPDLNPTGLKENYALSIVPGSLLNTKKITQQTKEEIASYMKKLNVSLVTDSAYIAQYRKYFELLQSEDDVPLIFHCTAGKDRTGMGAALYLFALGVDEESIMKDYLKSNIYLAEKYKKHIEEHPNLETLLTVDKEFLQAGIIAINDTYGSVENYLTKELNVDIELMKKLYLYN